MRLPSYADQPIEVVTAETRKNQSESAGVAAGMIVAFGTFAVFIVLNFVRVNLFLDELTSRADWQSMMRRFRSAGAENLRLFVNLDYLRGTPFKIAAATGFGPLTRGRANAPTA